MKETDKNMQEKLLDEKEGFRMDLFQKIPLLKKAASSRYFQFLLVLPNLFVFYVVILSGLMGNPVGNRNIAIVLIWIFWWFLLIAILVPFFARLWCLMCPLPFFGDLMQRFSFISVRTGKTGYHKNKYFGLNKTWPKSLKNIWLPNFFFLLLCTFSAILVTRPYVTSIVLGSMMAAATVLAIVYRLRVFCSYVCPVSGFIGLYSSSSTLELRSKDKDVCNKCRDKGCLRGNESGWGCPWHEYTGNMERNNYCGLCMECVKSCKNDNVALNLRPFAKETKIRSSDESWKGFIDVGTSHAYSLIYLGSNGTLKNWVNPTESGDWYGFLIYAVALWAISLVIVPVVFYIATSLSKYLAKDQQLSFYEVFKAYSYVLIPVGLLAWIAFSFPLILVNGSYVVSVISDPLGWGWDLFNTAKYPWKPILPEYIGYMQSGLLLTGMGYSIDRGYYIGQRIFGSKKAALMGLIPVAFIVTAIVLAFVVFFMG